MTIQRKTYYKLKLRTGISFDRISKMQIKNLEPVTNRSQYNAAHVSIVLIGRLADTNVISKTSRKPEVINEVYNLCQIV